MPAAASATAASNAAAAVPSAEDLEQDILRRRERVRAWQEARRKEETGGADSGPDEPQDPDSVPVKKGWSLDEDSDDGDDGLGNEGDAEHDGDEDDEDEDDADGGGASATDMVQASSPVLFPTPPTAPRGRDHGLEDMEDADVAGTSANDEAGDVDEDPLEAFMSSLDASDEVVPQESLNDLRSHQAAAGRGGARPLGSSNTISFEELLGQSKGESEGWESDVRSEDAEEDEEELERDKAEFMRAMRELHGVSKPELPSTADGPSSSASGAATAGDLDQAALPASSSLPPPQTSSSSHSSAQSVTAPAVPGRPGSHQTLGGKEDKPQPALGRIFGDDGDVMEEHEREDQEKSALETLQEALKKKELAPVDHTLIDYISVRKNLYIVPRVLAPLARLENAKQLAELREKLEIKVRGRGCPPPVETWDQCGLPDRVLKQLRKVLGEDSTPFAVQKQAIPAIMSGRDVIGIAKTGSGKTLAFLLPMIRHILDQPPLGEGEGPVGLIMAPARELAVQIYKEARKFTKALALRVTAIYGGAGVKEQIGEMKRGAEIVVCTPGRMIDILTMQAGKLVSLSRVSTIVLDEADRMFDMGFEPQIRMILQNIRPDRQTCLFSATFPPKVEALAKKVLSVPLEIVVGGRSVANSSITQYAEVRNEDDKFMRLLQLLGVWFERGHILVFVDTQQRCDRLFEDLLRHGYPCLSLHGGKDQIDREQTISDYKSKVCTLMVATSVAGRGLDVPELCCVVNYSCPNHLEDYVHRVGRTGRAGRKGTAYTFITPEEDQFAPLLVKALTQAEQEVPKALEDMSEQFKAKIASGQARWAGSGYGGSGFKFDHTEKNEAQKLADMQRRQYEIDQGLRDPADPLSDVEGGEDSMDEEELADARVAAEARARAEEAARAGGASAATGAISLLPTPGASPLDKAKQLAAQLAGGALVPATPGGLVPFTAAPNASIQAKLALAKRVAEQLQLNTSSAGTPGVLPSSSQRHYSEELEINDFPQKARRKVNEREVIADVSENFRVAIISRGSHIPAGKQPGPDEKKLYLLIEGHSETDIRGARKELLRILNEEVLRSGLDQSSRYQVV